MRSESGNFKGLITSGFESTNSVNLDHNKPANTPLDIVPSAKTIQSPNLDPGDFPISKHKLPGRRATSSNQKTKR
jgi:hypothetical protein